MIANLITILGLVISVPAAAQVQRSIVNGGFEEIDPGGPRLPTAVILPNAQVPGWDSTTGQIEIWDSGFGATPSAVGNSHAELNAFDAGALYQNICMINGETISWRFAHRARGSSSQNASLQIANTTGPLIQNLQTSTTTDPTAWVFRSNTAGVVYTGTSGEKRVQFSTTNGGAVGNFLDDISIGLIPFIEFDAASTSAIGAGSSPTLPALRVTGNFTSSVDVTVNVTGGTTTLGSDFTTPSGTSSFVITIPAGDYQSVRIPLGIAIITGVAGAIEPTKTIQLSITPNPPNFSIDSTTVCGGTPNATTLHAAVDNDVPPVAVADTATGVNGLNGSNSVLNVLTGDTVNGLPATATNASLSVASGSSLPSQLTFNATTGVVGVTPGTPAGVYSFVYQICDVLNPTECRTATASVTVVAAAIAADADSVSGVNTVSGAIGALDVLAGDTLNGIQVALSQIAISVITPATPISGGRVPVLITATGLINVPAGTPPGVYTISYKICETLNPTNCATNTATVSVAIALIVANNDSMTGVNGLTGASNVLNVLAGDTVNGAAATISTVTITVASGSSVPSRLSFNVATGNVSALAGTPAGTYSFNYRICETISPANCKTASVSVTVGPSADLRLTKTNTLGVNGEADQASDIVVSGATTSYTLVVTNNGPDSVIDSLVRDTIGTGLTCPAANAVTFTGNGVPVGSFTVADLIGPGITLDTLASGQSVTLIYFCTVN